MNWQPIPSVTEPTYADTNLNTIQKCLGWYHYKTPQGLVLKSLPGYLLNTTTANNAGCRGAKFDPNTRITVSVHGNTVYALDDLSATALTGTLTTSSGYVVMASGLSHMMLVDGTDGYKIDLVGLTVTRITDANFTPLSPISCACINGQFLVLDANTDRWYMSAVDDALTWTPVISGRAIINADQLAHVEVAKDVVYFIGYTNIEGWAPSTDDPFLQPISGATLPIGCLASQQVARVGDTIAMISRSERGNPSFHALIGGQLQKIATPYIESRIKHWDTVARLVAYSLDGTDFLEAYESTLSGSAFLYNFSAGTWSEIDYTRQLIAAVNPYSSTHECFGFDSRNGKIYTLGESSRENGSNINKILYFKLDGGMSRTFNAGLRFEFEARHEISSSYTFTATLQKSDDAGRTFDTGITLTKSVTNGTSAQQVILQTPPLGSFKAGRIYSLTINMAAYLILRRAGGLVQIGRA